MDFQGASNSALRINEITRAFTHLETTDEVLLDAAKYDKEDELKEIFQEPDSFDINHRDGFVHCLQPSYRTPSLS